MASMRPLAILESNHRRIPSLCRLTVRATFLTGSSRDRMAQLLDEGHDKRFEQKREAGSGSCPRHVDKAHAAVRTVDASDARMQEGLVLEEIEVAPGLLDGVVHWAVGLAAIRALKAATNLEVDLDVELLPLGVELGVRHHPRRHQAECELEQIDIAHGPSPRHVRCHRAAVLAAVKNKPLRARDPRAFLTATRHVGV